MNQKENQNNMDKSLIATKSIQINSTPEKIWSVLTNPEKIKTYLFGTEVKTDWKEGSPITFSGEYEGHKYEDKGNIIENMPNELLNYNYWSGFSGLEDKPENYSLVSYRIKKLNDKTYEFTWHQQGFSSEEGKCHTEEGLEKMLEQIKKLSEE